MYIWFMCIFQAVASLYNEDFPLQLIHPDFPL